jgi:hypothetical protein
MCPPPLALEPPVARQSMPPTLELAADDLVDNSLYLNKEFLQLLQEDFYYNHIYKSSSYYFNQSKFFKYLNEWSRFSMFSSDVQKITSDPNFEAMVAMGVNAIPFILHELEHSPSILVWVLNKITKFEISERSISVEDACSLWIKWGRKYKLI